MQRLIFNAVMFSFYPSSLTITSRGFLPASCSLSMIKASSFVMASEMYLNDVDFTKSSLKKKKKQIREDEFSGFTYLPG